MRPPGHHAGANGLESDAVSCGFCLFNNIAIGALHALKERSPTVQKVAVIDFDVHHGNGTQAILEGFDDPSSVFFFSIHLYDSDRDCPNCLPSELRPSNGSGGNGGGGKDIGGGLKRPSAPPGIDEFEFYPGTVRQHLSFSLFRLSKRSKRREAEQKLLRTFWGSLSGRSVAG